MVGDHYDGGGFGAESAEFVGAAAMEGMLRPRSLDTVPRPPLPPMDADGRAELESLLTHA